MKKKSLALVLAAGMAVTTFGGTGSAFADSKNVLSTKKYNETVQSPEFISGDQLERLVRKRNLWCLIT